MCDPGGGDHVRETDVESDRRPIADSGYLPCHCPVCASERHRKRACGGRPDGTVSETTLLRDVPLLSDATVFVADETSLQAFRR
jgi:hypothetical protein